MVLEEEEGSHEQNATNLQTNDTESNKEGRLVPTLNSHFLDQMEEDLPPILLLLLLMLLLPSVLLALNFLKQQLLLLPHQQPN